MPSIRKMPQLNDLRLIGNNSGNEECEQLAIKLGDPNCKCTTLALKAMQLVIVVCAFLADALESNTALDCMILKGGRKETIGLTGWDPTAQALYSTSSINQQSAILVKSHTEDI